MYAVTKLQRLRDLKVRCQSDKLFHEEVQEI